MQRKHRALCLHELSQCWVYGRQSRYRTSCTHFQTHNAPTFWDKLPYQSYDHPLSQSTRSPCSTSLRHGVFGSAGIRTHPPHRTNIDSAAFRALALLHITHYRTHYTRTHRTLLHLWARLCLASPRSALTSTTRKTMTPLPSTICCTCTPFKGWDSTHIPDESLPNVHCLPCLFLSCTCQTRISWLLDVYGVALCVFR